MDKFTEDFEKWYIKNIIGVPFTIGFSYLHPSMQYGVYVDFFDSVGIEIEIYKDYDMTDIPAELNGWIYYFDQEDNNKWFKTRQETREQAIIKANKIYNLKP